MALLIGRYEYSLDPKNRLSVPPKFREALDQEKGQKFFLTSGFDRCLYLYLPSEWRKLENKLPDLALPDKEQQRAFLRRFFSEASDVEPDSAGRILIPQYLKEHAGLNARIFVHGAGNKAEIWDYQKWSSYNKSMVEPTYRRVSKTLDI